MGVYAMLVCPTREMSMYLGKRQRNAEGQMVGFSLGPRWSADDPELTAALWAFLADTAGEPLRVAFDYDEDFEVLAGYTEIGGDAETGDIPFADYIRSIAARASTPRPTGSQPG